MNKNNLNSTIFIVEDDDQIAYLLDFMLSREGYQVVAAIHGAEAQQMILDIEPPALVLLDVMLPFVDGYELMQLIRQHPAWQQVPVIMLSAKSQEQDIVHALEFGANDYIVKPFQPLELLARVKRYLKKS